MLDCLWLIPAIPFASSLVLATVGSRIIAQSAALIGGRCDRCRPR